MVVAVRRAGPGASGCAEGVRGRRWKIQGARVLFIYFIQDCVLRIIGFFIITLNVINKYIFFY